MSSELPKGFIESSRESAKIGKIPVFGDITEENQSLIIDCIGIASRSLLPQSKEWCTLYINCLDRRMNSIVPIKSAMLESGLKFRGFVVDKAYYSGFNLLQSCNWRVGMTNSRLLYSYGYFMITNDMLSGVIENNQYFLDFLKISLLQTVSEISERSGISKETLGEYARLQRVFLAQEAVTLGFLDEVVSFLPKSERPV